MRRCRQRHRSFPKHAATPCGRRPSKERQEQTPSRSHCEPWRDSDGQGTDDVSESHGEVLTFTVPEQGEQQWALRDSNPRPQPCESVSPGQMGCFY